MKKILILTAFLGLLASCSDTDECNCEVYEQIEVNDNIQYRFIGTLSGSCDSQTVKKPEYIYEDINC